MEVDILIDKITDCLIDTRTGEEVETEYRMRKTPMKPKDYKGWKFNWSITEKNGYHIYEEVGGGYVGNGTKNSKFYT